MQAEDRPIHFSTELIFPPFQLKIPALQSLYYELSQVPAAAYDSADFSMPGPPRFYTRRGTKAQSIALFLPDRVVLIEEWVEIPLSRFLTKMLEVASRVLSGFEIGAFVAQTATIRTTFSLTHFDDAKTFLLDHVCGQEGQIDLYFGRLLGTAGLRFVMPRTEDHPGELHVIIESYRHNQREVFVETKGIYSGEQITADSLDSLRDNMERVRTFISHHVYPFLQQYDAAPKGNR